MPEGKQLLIGNNHQLHAQRHTLIDSGEVPIKQSDPVKQKGRIAYDCTESVPFAPPTGFRIFPVYKLDGSRPLFQMVRNPYHFLRWQTKGILRMSKISKVIIQQVDQT